MGAGASVNSTLMTLAAKAKALDQQVDRQASSSSRSNPEPPPPKAWEKAIGVRVEVLGLGTARAIREYYEELASGSMPGDHLLSR